MENLELEIMNLVITVLTICVGIVTRYIVSYLKKKGLVAQLQNNKEQTKIVVSAIEQTYKTLHGKEKLNMAKLELIKLMKQKKIKITEKELDVMIEAMVKEMNDTIKDELKK